MKMAIKIIKFIAELKEGPGKPSMCPVYSRCCGEGYSNHTPID
jgi:hypothetical protein